MFIINGQERILSKTRFTQTIFFLVQKRRKTLPARELPARLIALYDLGPCRQIILASKSG